MSERLVTVAYGDTYSHKEWFRSHGWRWNHIKKVWVADGDQSLNVPGYMEDTIVVEVMPMSGFEGWTGPSEGHQVAEDDDSYEGFFV